MAQLYKCYLDESGTHQASDAVVVAGFISNTSKWVTFSQEWKTLLGEWQIPYFHMTDFENRRGYYSSWSDEEHKNRLNRLLEIIKQQTFMSIAYVIGVRQFDKFLSDKAKKFCGDAYGLASIACWFNLRQLVKKVDGYIDYIMESGCKGRSALEWIYGEQSTYPEWIEDTRISSLMFGDKKVTLPLQAADILAYEVYKHTQRQFGGLKLPIRYPYKQLCIPGRNKWHYANDAELKKTNDYLNDLIGKTESRN